VIPKLVAFAAGLAVALVPTAAQAAQPHPFAGQREVTVMTQNLYLGTDLRPIFAAPSPAALLGAVSAGWQQVLANDFPSRAEAIADEIAAAQPDLVALQEAELYRTDVPSDGAATPAETVALDFMAELNGALARRGLDYVVASSFSGTDAELPAGLPPAFDLRLTDRLFILARADESTADLKVSNPQAGAYAAALTVPTVAGALTLPRGWASVDVKIRGREFRFVTTHLEAFSLPVRNAQAAELVAATAATELPVVVVGDLNSGPGVDLGAYTILLDGGFADAAASGGSTCCFGTDLHDSTGTLTKRIDLVLTRGAFTTVAAEVVGDEPGDRTPNGLWPSDHAGVVATLRLAA
jgi:endonuclease/exonuclease/phosphatase family metal-dependent hydrolase